MIIQKIQTYSCRCRCLLNNFSNDWDNVVLTSGVAGPRWPTDLFEGDIPICVFNEFVRTRPDSSANLPFFIS